jgi:polyisoprenoid-binding protein YceI
MRQRKIIAALVSMAISIAAFSQGWTADKAHSKVGFEVTHLLVTDVDGNFKKFDITVNSAKDDFTDAVS